MKIAPREVDLLHLHLLRQGKERSKVTQSKYYGRGGDPANHVQFDSEKENKPTPKKTK